MFSTERVTHFVFLISFCFSQFFVENVLCEKCFNSVVKDPDEDRNVVQIIESRGFKAESHYVTTKDGYILTIQRIINPKLVNQKSKRPIILQHGVLSASFDWVMGSPGLGIDLNCHNNDNCTIGNNLGFALSVIGYDVWLTNTRGNVYGTNHTTLNPKKDKKFWEFSFDEMIEYDLPAIIQYVLKNTNHTTLGYVGHSQGTLLMFGLLSTFPQYSEVIKPFIALAPIARVAHIESPIRLFADNPLVMEYFYLKGGAFLPSPDLVNIISEKVCRYAVIRELCANILFLFTGFDISQLNETRLPVYYAHEPAGTSAWNIIHFGQGVLSKSFRKFDFGKKVNLQKYGTKTPPVYNLSNIRSKHIAILHSHNDWLSDPKDVAYLRSQISDKLILDYEIPIRKWNHMDFVWAVQAGKYVNSIVVKLLKTYN